MTAKPLTKAHLSNAIAQATRFAVTDLPFELKDQVKSARMHVVASDVSNRMRNSSVAVIVLEFPKQKPLCSL